MPDISFSQQEKDDIINLLLAADKRNDAAAKKRLLDLASNKELGGGDKVKDEILQAYTKRKPRQRTQLEAFTEVPGSLDPAGIARGLFHGTAAAVEAVPKAAAGIAGFAKSVIKTPMELGGLAGRGIREFAEGSKTEEEAKARATEYGYKRPETTEEAEYRAVIEAINKSPEAAAVTRSMALVKLDPNNKFEKEKLRNRIAKLEQMKLSVPTAAQSRIDDLISSALLLVGPAEKLGAAAVSKVASTKIGAPIVGTISKITKPIAELSEKPVAGLPLRSVRTGAAFTAFSSPQIIQNMYTQQQALEKRRKSLTQNQYETELGKIHNQALTQLVEAGLTGASAHLVIGSAYQMLLGGATPAAVGRYVESRLKPKVTVLVEETKSKSGQKKLMPSAKRDATKVPQETTRPRPRESLEIEGKETPTSVPPPLVTAPSAEPDQQLPKLDTSTPEYKFLSSLKKDQILTEKSGRRWQMSDEGYLEEIDEDGNPVINKDNEFNILPVKSAGKMRLGSDVETRETTLRVAREHLEQVKPEEDASAVDVIKPEVKTRKKVTPVIKLTEEPASAKVETAKIQTETEEPTPLPSKIEDIAKTPQDFMDFLEDPKNEEFSNEVDKLFNIRYPRGTKFSGEEMEQAYYSVGRSVLAKMKKEEAALVPETTKLLKVENQPDVVEPLGRSIKVKTREELNIPDSAIESDNRLSFEYTWKDGKKNKTLIVPKDGSEPYLKGEEVIPAKVSAASSPEDIQESIQYYTKSLSNLKNKFRNAKTNKTKIVLQEDIDAHNSIISSLKEMVENPEVIKDALSSDDLKINLEIEAEIAAKKEARKSKKKPEIDLEAGKVIHIPEMIDRLSKKIGNTQDAENLTLRDIGRRWERANQLESQKRWNGRFVSRESYEAARDRLISKIKQGPENFFRDERGEIDKQDIGDIITTGAYWIEQGLTGFPEWSSRLYETFGGWLHKHAKSIYSAAMNKVKIGAAEESAREGAGIAWQSDKEDLSEKGHLEDWAQSHKKEINEIDKDLEPYRELGLAPEIKRGWILAFKTTPQIDELGGKGVLGATHITGKASRFDRNMFTVSRAAPLEHYKFDRGDNEGYLMAFLLRKDKTYMLKGEHTGKLESGGVLVSAEAVPIAVIKYTWPKAPVKGKYRIYVDSNGENIDFFQKEDQSSYIDIPKNLVDEWDKEVSTIVYNSPGTAKKIDELLKNIYNYVAFHKQNIKLVPRPHIILDPNAPSVKKGYERWYSNGHDGIYVNDFSKLENLEGDHISYLDLNRKYIDKFYDTYANKKLDSGIINDTDIPGYNKGGFISFIKTYPGMSHELIEGYDVHQLLEAYSKNPSLFPIKSLKDSIDREGNLLLPGIKRKEIRGEATTPFSATRLEQLVAQEDKNVAEQLQYEFPMATREGVQKKVAGIKDSDNKRGEGFFVDKNGKLDNYGDYRVIVPDEIKKQSSEAGVGHEDIQRWIYDNKDKIVPKNRERLGRGGHEQFGAVDPMFMSGFFLGGASGATLGAAATGWEVDEDGKQRFSWKKAIPGAAVGGILGAISGAGLAAAGAKHKAGGIARKSAFESIPSLYRDVNERMSEAWKSVRTPLASERLSSFIRDQINSTKFAIRQIDPRKYPEVYKALVPHKTGHLFKTAQTLAWSRLETMVDKVQKMSPQHYGAFMKKLLLDSFWEDIERNRDAGGEDSKMAFPFYDEPGNVKGTAVERIENDLNSLNNDIATKYPEIIPELENFRNEWRTSIDEIKKMFSDLKLPIPDLNRDFYFPYIKHAYEEIVAGGTGRGGIHYRTPGYFKTREKLGDPGAILTDPYNAYLRVLTSLNVLKDRLKVGTAVLKTSIHKQLQKEVRDANEKLIDEIKLKEIQDPINNGFSPTEESLRHFETQIGIAFRELRKLAKKNQLWDGANHEYKAVVDDIRNPPSPGNYNEGTQDYLSALYTSKEPGSGFAGMIFKNQTSRIQFVAETLGHNYKDISDVTPKGYVPYQFMEGRFMFPSKTIPLQMYEEAVDAGLTELGVPLDKIRTVLSLGKERSTWVIPEDVANALEKVYKGKGSTAWTKFIGAQKVFILHRPTGFFGRARHFSSDALQLTTRDIKGWKYVKDATEQLKKLLIDKNPHISKEMEGYIGQGNIQETMNELEAGVSEGIFNISKEDINSLARNKSPEGLRLAWNAYWRGTRTGSDFALNIFRYAEYLKLLDDLKASGGKVSDYLSSDRKIIDRLPTNEDKAHLLMNDVFGNYQWRSEKGKYLSKVAIPFFSLNENALRTNYGMLKNILHDDIAAATAGKTMAERLGIATRKAGPMALYKLGSIGLKLYAAEKMIDVWNNVVFPKTEDNLPKQVKDRLHINLPGGKAISRLGMYDEVLHETGLYDAGPRAKELLNGDTTYKEFTKEWLATVAGDELYGASPIRMLAEFWSGVNLSSLEPYPTKNRALQLATNLGLGGWWQGLTRTGVGGLEPLPVRSGNWSKASAFNLPYKTYFPGEGAYQDARAMKFKFFSRKGKTLISQLQNEEKSNSLYNIKKSIQLGDEGTARYYLWKYASLGGDKQSLNKSIESLDPRYGLTKVDKVDGVVMNRDGEEWEEGQEKGKQWTDDGKEFWSKLTPEQQSRFDQAILFYENNLKPGRFLSLYPMKAYESLPDKPKRKVVNE